MHDSIQFRGFRSSAWSRLAVCKLPIVFLAFFLTYSPLAGAQQSFGGMVGSIEGNEVSVQGPSTPGNSNETITSSILVGNGSVVTVHSGQARMTLFTGGEVDICGPAKFTLLQSGGAITLAVELGRMRVRLPETATLRLFTPTVVATPIEINGGARDITVGLDLNNSLCVLAASGAIQLEHQFSGERLIVPQSGEFFLNAGKLLPVVGNPGSCQCAAMSTRPPTQSATEPSEYASNIAPLTAPPLHPKTQPAPATSGAATEPQSSVEFSTPVNSNNSHPVAPLERNTPAPIAPSAPASSPVYTVVAPPLTFSASSPNPPPEPPVDTFLLVREAQVVPSWEFKGHVAPPTFADAMQSALGEGPATKQPPEEPQKKRPAVWQFFRRIFKGNSAQE
jgi:hypothetical protein